MTEINGVMVSPKLREKIDDFQMSCHSGKNSVTSNGNSSEDSQENQCKVIALGTPNMRNSKIS